MTIAKTLRIAGTARKRRVPSVSQLIVPMFLTFWAFIVVVPLLIVAVYSFFSVEMYQIVYKPTLDTWRSIIDTGRWLVALKTFRITLTITLIELVLAIPFALWLAKGCKSKPIKAASLTLLTVPFFLDVSSRIIVWRPVLGTNGIVNVILMQLGIVDQPIEWLLYSEFAVHFGLIGTYFPTMVFPIFMSMTLIDDDFLAASRDLGATPARTFRNVILPLAMPGILVGVVFTSVPLMATFVESQLLGGGFVDLLGNSVNSALSQNQIPTAAVLSTMVVVFLALSVIACVLLTRKRVDLKSVFTARHS